jgi:hypothetical protein
LLLPPGGHSFENADFDDAVGLGVDTGRLKVKNHERFVQYEMFKHRDHLLTRKGCTNRQMEMIP